MRVKKKGAILLPLYLIQLRNLSQRKSEHFEDFPNSRKQDEEPLVIALPGFFVGTSPIPDNMVFLGS